jgi:hypothetical protein
MLTYLHACLGRGLSPLCQLPGLFPQLGLVLDLREDRYGPAATVLTLSSGQIAHYDLTLLDPYNP